MNQLKINEIHEILIKYCIENNIKPSEIMAFITATFIGQMALSGYSQDFFDKTVEKMKEKFKYHPLRKK